MLWTTCVALRQDINRHHHDLHELVVCLTGTIKVDIKEQQHHFAAGHSVFIPASYEHSIQIDRQHETKLLFACIDRASFNAMANPANSQFLKKLADGECLANNAIATVPGEGQDLQLIAHELGNLPNTGAALHACLKENLYLKLLLVHIKGGGHEQRFKDPLATRMIKAQQWINENYTENLTLDIVAKQVNVSRSHFARQFRQQTGFSMVDYLLKVRCDAAAKGLANSILDVSEIAFATGFSNLSHFYRHFKRRYGVTPGAFRQMIRNQGANAFDDSI